MRILLDMDEVLSDFIGGVARLWGVPLSEIERYWTPDVYDIIPPLSAAVGRTEPLTEEAFWVATEHDGFWEGLDPLPWANRLIKVVGEITDDWWVVTSPSRGRYCVSEKQVWLNRFFGVSWFQRMEPVRAKYLLANPETVLVDDRESNIDSFRKAGGSGILFPRHHNRLRHLRDDPLGHVLEELSRFSLARKTSCT